MWGSSVNMGRDERCVSWAPVLLSVKAVDMIGYCCPRMQALDVFMRVWVCTWQGTAMRG